MSCSMSWPWVNGFSSVLICVFDILSLGVFIVHPWGISILFSPGDSFLLRWCCPHVTDAVADSPANMLKWSFLYLIARVIWFVVSIMCSAHFSGLPCVFEYFSVSISVKQSSILFWGVFSVHKHSSPQLLWGSIMLYSLLSVSASFSGSFSSYVEFFTLNGIVVMSNVGRCFAVV